MKQIRTSLSHVLPMVSLLLAIAGTPATANTSVNSSDAQPTKEETKKTPDDKETSPPIKLSDITLAQIEGFADEAAYQQSLSNVAAELVEQARQSSDTAKQAKLWLLAANLILAHNVEPACTRILLRLPAKQHTEQSVSRLLDTVDEYLNHTSKIISQMPDKQPPDDPACLAQTTKKVRILKAFSAALRAIILPDHIENVARARRSAASDLAIWLEDSDEKIAAAAVLWYAALRGHESRLAPSMQVLPLATEELSRKALPFVFFSRLLRCEILADHGSYAASLALLTKLEDHCEDWFINDVDRADALRAVSVVETEVLRLWHDSLTDPSQHQPRAWCDQKLKELLNSRFQEPSHTVMRLRPAIPLITSAEATHNSQSEGSR